MPERKFYKTIVTIEILSEKPYMEDDLTTIAYDIDDEGDCAGVVSVGESVAVDGKTMVNLLHAQKSDPAFFGLDDNGVHADDLEEDLQQDLLTFFGLDDLEEDPQEQEKS